MNIFIISFLRKKNTYLFFCIMTICLCFLFISGIIYYYIYDKLNQSSNIETSRELMISTYDEYSNVKRTLENENAIVNVYKSIVPFNSNIKIDNNVIECMISSSYYNYINIDSSNIFKFDEKNDILFPSKINYNSNILLMDKYNGIIFNIINSENETEFEGKITGIYNYSDKKNNYVFIPYEDFIKNFYHNYSNQDNGYLYTIVVDKIDNVKDVIDTLQKKGYNDIIYDSSLQRETNILNNLYLIVKIIIASIFFAIFIILNLIINSIISDENIDIAILKSIGYNNKYLFRISLLKTTFLSSVAFAISIFLLLFMTILWKNIFSTLFNIEFILKISMIKWIFIFYLIIIVLCIISNLLIISKIKKIQPILLFNL